jgi:four helix bundle suffix protein
MTYTTNGTNGTDKLLGNYGGYRKLKSFQASVIIYDLTVEFCERYIKSFKLKDQIEGAARSGSQNIGEASKNSGTSKQSELRLMQVARASLEELKLDFEAFLRQNNLAVWEKGDARVVEVRRLAYIENRTNGTYGTYMTNAESAANCLLCLINQANFLLDNQLKFLSKDLVMKGDFKDRFKELRKQEILGKEKDYDEFLRELGMKRLQDGRVVEL